MSEFLNTIIPTQLVALDPVERRRVYHHRSGKTWSFKDVTHFLARPSGSHRLRTADGLCWVVPGAVVNESVIELDMDNFTV